MRSTFVWAGSGLGSGFGGPELNPNVCLKLSKSPPFAKPRRILQRLKGQRDNNIEEEEDNGSRRVRCRCDLGTLPFNNDIFWSVTCKHYPLFFFGFVLLIC